MKVVLCANTSWYLYNFRRNLIAQLRNTGVEIFVIAPYDEYASRFQDLGVEYIHLRLHQTSKNVLQELRSVLELARLLKMIQPDATLTFTIKCNLYIGLLNNIIPCHQIANISGLGEGFERQGGLSRFIQLLYRYALRGAFKIFFQNQEDLQMFSASNRDLHERSERLPGSGVDLNAFKPDLRAGPSHSKRIFLMFGRVLPKKGYDLFLQAAAYITQSRPGRTEFWVLGMKDGSRKESLMLFQKILEYHDNNIITYFSASDDVVPFIQQADVIVLPSEYHEGVPRSLLEAMACAKPIVTTDWKGCRDTVDDRVNGILIEKGNVDSLIHALEFFINANVELIHQMGGASRKKAESDFDERFIIHAYLNALDACCSSESHERHGSMLK